jgi:hypothetical protein
LTVPTLPFPPRIVDGAFVLIEQNSQEDIDGSVECAARTPYGYLDSNQEFGMPDYVLTRGTPSAEEVRAQIRAQEPRVDLLTDSELLDRVATITIDPGVVTDGR